VQKVKIITDSASDLPLQFFKEYSISMLPMGVVIGDKTYLDRMELDSKTFFNMMREDDSSLPKTVMPSAGLMEEEFRKNLDAYENQIFICISSKGSGTYNVANMIKKSIEDELDRPSNITVIDTFSYSAGYGMVVREMARLAYEGADYCAVMDKYNELISKIKVLLVVDDLKHLQRGGRINPTIAFVGGMLGIKPLLTIKNGIIDSFGKERGKRRAMEKMLEIMLGEVENPEQTNIWIVNADATEDAQIMRQMILEKITPKEIVDCELGACIGTHTGGGLVGIVYDR